MSTFDPTKFGATAVTPPAKVGGTPSAGAFDPTALGATAYTPPAPAPAPATGIANTMVDWAYGGAKAVVQAVDKPFLAALGVPAELWDSLTGKPDAAATAKAGYDYGDFFGKASPLGAGFDPNKSVADHANMKVIADTAGQLIEAGSYFIGVGEVGAAAKLGAKTAPGVMGAVKGAATSQIGKFSAAQGAAAGLESYGQGATPGEAVTTAGISTIASAGLMKMFDVIGTPLQKSLQGFVGGGFVAGALKTKVGEALTKTMDGISTTIQKMAENPAFKGITDSASSAAKSFQVEYRAVQSQVNNATLSFLGGVKEYLNVPKDQTTWVKEMMDKSYGALRVMDNQKEAAFNKVYNSGVVIPKATNLEKSVAGILSDIESKTAEAPSKIAGLTAEEAAQAFGGEAPKTSVMLPDLRAFIGQVQSRILDPIKAGAGFNIKEGNIFKNFLGGKGTEAEKAMVAKLQAALHEDITTGLGTLGASGKKVLSDMEKATSMAKNISNIKDSAFSSIFAETKNAKSVAQAFIDGGILKDSSQVKDLEALIGPIGIGQLRSQMMHTTLSNAIDAFTAVTKKGVTALPEDFANARKAAVAEIDKLLSAVDGRMNLKPTGSGFQALSDSQTKWMHDAKQFIQGSNMEDIAKGFGIEIPGGAAGVAAKSDVLARATEAYAAAKTPGELATNISKMTNIEDIKAVMSIVDKSPGSKQALGAQIIKNFIDSSATAFKTGTNAAGYKDAMKSVLDIGGANKKEAYDLIFGKGTETDALLHSMDAANKAFEAFDTAKTPSALDAVANAVIGVGLHAAGHPIMATGFYAKAVKAGTAKGADNVFKEFTGKTKTELLKSYETDGKIDPSKVAKMWRKLGTIMKSKTTERLAGHEAAQTVAGSPETATDDTITQ